MMSIENEDSYEEGDFEKIIDEIIFEEEFEVSWTLTRYLVPSFVLKEKEESVQCS